MNRLRPFLSSAWGRHAFSLAVGAGIAVLLHYLLFRLTLPIQPFIYVSF